MATITLYNKQKLYQQDGTAVIDYNSDSIKVMLVDSTYTPSATTHDYIDDANGDEVTGTNYTAGGAALGTLSCTESAGTVTFDAADVTWTQSGTGFSNARYAIIYKDTGTPATSPVFGYIDFTADKGNVTGDLTVQWNAAGICTWS